MDDEGFPLLQPGARLQPVVERPDTVDQESGEATGRKVVVLRNPRLNATHSGLRFRRHALYPSSLFQPSPRLSQRLTFHQEFGRVPPLWSEENAIFARPLYRLHSDQKTESGGAVSKVPFRVPQVRPEVTPQKINEVTITIWREFCRGPLVYEDVSTSFRDLKDQCLLWPHLQALFGDSAVLVPLCVVWLVRTLLVMLKVFIPWLGLQLTYFHFLYVHLKIHVTGEKKGVRPVFIGEACQGPMIYSIRHLCCPYCRYTKQCNIALRYFEILLRERQGMAAR
ncbi:uncharacterized protein LOC127004055 [Eriocheir sinensis]|uniref:uncharacterized protein LOC127004055 n=1 Tax=Eriocheir sinensis TaxID=95602 RepID=UPI0021C68213|nr:uncharacterized protein LOC127004055 [Eriocheir sinensis]